MTESRIDWEVCPSCGRESPTRESFISHYSTAHDEPYPWRHPTELREKVRELYEDPKKNRSYREIADVAGCDRETVDEIVTRSDFERSTEDKFRKTGPDSPWWKEKTRGAYGTYFQTQAEKVRNRDNNLCQWCREVSNGDHIDRFSNQLHAHHIVGVEEFRGEDGMIDRKEAHSMDNLVAFCQPCHNAAERLEPWQVRQIITMGANGTFPLGPD